jgi:endonuclease/exonuclease/phosphatase family metal-dependent hydrolase
VRRWIAIAVVAPWAAWAIGRTFGLDRVHPLIAFVAFTPYVAATAPIPVIVALILRRRLPALVALVAAVLLAVAVLPRWLSVEEHGRGSGAATVMTSNLFGGRGDPERVVELVRRHRVDVLFLEELRPDAVERLDRAGLRALLPHRALEARPGSEGNGILSRHPLRRVPEWERSNEPAADVTIPGFTAPVRVRVVHPFPPLGHDKARAWRAHLHELPPPPRDRTAVIAGDFNATLDHRALRAVLDRGWQDAAAEAGKGLRPTWPVGRRILGLAIDHVLVSPGVVVGPVSIHEIPGSDHRAVIARLALPGS